MLTEEQEILLDTTIGHWYKVNSEKRMLARIALLKKESAKADEIFNRLNAIQGDLVNMCEDYTKTCEIFEREYPNRFLSIPKIIKKMFHYHNEAGRYLELLKGVHNNWKKEFSRF